MRTIRNSPRKALVWLHRWIGLTLGLVFVGYGLTGSYIVFMDEIEALYDPSVKYASAPVEQVSIAALASAVSLPEGALRIRVPQDPARSVEFLYNKEPSERLTEYVDPATMQRIATRAWSSSLTGILYSFHHDLFLGKPGKTVTAIQASMVLAMIMIGLWLWLPPRGQRAADGFKATAFKRARGRLRQYLELHKLIGIYTVVLLMITVGSGILIARSDWFLHLQKPTPLAPSVMHYEALDAAIAKSGLPTRGHQLRLREESVTLTRSDGSAYLLNVEKGLFEPRTRDDQNDRIYDFFRDIHGGRYWDGHGANLTFAIGFLPLFFYVTGVVIWWKKRSNRRKQASQQL